MGKGRAPCCDKEKVKKGAWTPAEDSRLTAYIHKHGHPNWRALPTLAGLMRCGKSCRLRWINYLRPDVKRGNFTPQEELTIINLHNSFGNKWSKIASYLPGRTDNEIKNVWNTHLKKRLKNPNLVDDHHCHEENEAKEYSTTTYSTSPSCTSSSITSGEDRNVQNALGVIQDSDIQDLDPNPNKNSELQKIQDPNPNKNPEFQKIHDLDPNPSEKPEFLKIESTHPIQDHKENPTCDSPTSSQASDYLATNRAEGDGKIEIPVDLDIDIWEELFDSLGEEDPNLHMGANEEGCNVNEWLSFLEDEVGHVDQTTPQEHDEIEYFPIWPSSPSNF